MERYIDPQDMDRPSVRDLRQPDEGSRHLHDEEPTGPLYVHPNEKLRQEAKALVAALEHVRAEPNLAVQIADAALAQWAAE